MCKTICNKTTGKKIDLQTRHVADSQNCKTNKDLQVKPDEGSVSKNKTNMPDYLTSSKSKTNIADYLKFNDDKEADRSVS